MKTIPLSRGQFALVDNEDYDGLNQFKWNAKWTKKTNTFYVTRHEPTKDGKRAFVQMHREIMKANSTMR